MSDEEQELVADYLRHAEQGIRKSKPCSRQSKAIQDMMNVFPELETMTIPDEHCKVDLAKFRSWFIAHFPTLAKEDQDVKDQRETNFDRFMYGIIDEDVVDNVFDQPTRAVQCLELFRKAKNPHDCLYAFQGTGIDFDCNREEFEEFFEENVFPYVASEEEKALIREQVIDSINTKRAKLEEEEGDD